MNLTVVLPLLATVVSLIFTLMIFDQYLHRHKPYQIIWSFGLLLFSVAAFAQFLGTNLGWRDNGQLYFRLWFICGAIGTSAFLGMGTIFLMARPKIARSTLVGLIIAFAAAAVLTFTAPVETNVLPACAAQEISVKVTVKDGHYDTVCPNPAAAPEAVANGKVLYALPGYVWGWPPSSTFSGQAFWPLAQFKAPGSFGANASNLTAWSATL